MPNDLAAGASGPPGTTLYTVGHGTSPQEEFGALLRGAGIRALVDVRTAPGSRRSPQFARGALERWLPAHGIAYRWDDRLGGFRRPPDDSPDLVLANLSFRGYAAHMRTRAFPAALDELLAHAATTETAVMCSESLWWRCHRRLLADMALAGRGVRVVHLMRGGRQSPHTTTEGLRRRNDGLLVYDVDLHAG